MNLCPGTITVLGFLLLVVIMFPVVDTTIFRLPRGPIQDSVVVMKYWRSS